MRQWIEYAVENYRSKNSFGFQLAKNLKARQIDTAIEQYARIVKPEEVVAILDTTVVKSGKSGFLLTDRYLYSSNEKEGAPVELMYLKSVSVREENNSYCILEYEDGRKRELYVSVFLDVADVLKMIAGKSSSPGLGEAEKQAQGHEKKQAAETDPGTERNGRTEFGEETGRSTGYHAEAAGDEPGAGESAKAPEGATGMGDRKDVSGSAAGAGENAEASAGALGAGDHMSVPGNTPGAGDHKDMSGSVSDAGHSTDASGSMPGAGEGAEASGSMPGVGNRAEASGSGQGAGAGAEVFGSVPRAGSGAEVSGSGQGTGSVAEASGSTGNPGGNAGMPETGQEEERTGLVSSGIAKDDAVMGAGVDLADELPKELSLEIVGLEELEDEEPKEADEPQWDTSVLQTEADMQEGSEGKESFDQVLAKAEAGDRAAMFEAAEMLYTGDQIQENQKEGLRWFRESAKAEYVPAMLRLMRFYEEGELVKKNLTLSMSWAKKAAATGEDEGQFALAKTYIYGQPGMQDTDKGIGILAEMAQKGNKEAEEQLLGVHQKIQEAKERFRAGVRNPSTASGYYEMGMYCKAGDGYYCYPKEAVGYFRKAAEKDHIHAQYQLALAYYTGAGVKKDEDESIRWLEKAAAKSHKEAGELLAKLQEKRRIKQEKNEFKNHLRQAEKGDVYAQSKTAELYLQGIGVKQDIKKGIEWYEKASETDEGYAARQLAKIYSDGELVPEDPEKAAYWRMVGGVLDEL
ncbi:MAG: sel1 repeat family protein [Dorea sp.]|jgi:TPR repeat protein|nr:sel1 repeat family protein [Dorea sp.]